MAYRQYTKCTSPGNYIGALAAQIIVAAVVGAIPLIMGLVFGALFAGPAVLAAMLIPLMAVLAYCRWWLYDRLICLGGDVCAVGTVLGVEPPDEKSGFDAFDTDYSVNLLLAPHEVGDTQSVIENDGIQGNLIKNQPPIVAQGLDFTGEKSSFPLSTTPDGSVFWSDPNTASFHAEFEGGGVYDLMLAVIAALGWDVAATIAAVIICAIPIIGWIACLIISLIFAAVTAGIVAVGMAVALGDTGNPNDVNANLGEIEQGKDLLVVKGTWVYDTAHTGWNEMHPIKHCQRIGKWIWPLPDGTDGPSEGPWSFHTWDDVFNSIKDLVPPNVTLDVKTYISYWCSAINDASDPTTITNQGNPSNHWNTHPDVDGCDPGDNGGEVPK
jgi:hypothetical protein